MGIVALSKRILSTILWFSLETLESGRCGYAQPDVDCSFISGRGRQTIKISERSNSDLVYAKSKRCY